MNQFARSDQHKVFKFPNSQDGLETVESRREMETVLRRKFQEQFGDRMEFPYLISERKRMREAQELGHKIIARCRICTNCLVYAKSTMSPTATDFKLVKISVNHVHSKGGSAVGRPDAKEGAEEFIKALPEVSIFKKRKIVCDKFQLTQTQFDSLYRGIKRKYAISFQQLLTKLEQDKFHIRILPAQMSQSPSTTDKQNACTVFELDKVNPHLPNILILISPKMKETYLKYGQYIGFDLTFSLIRDHPTRSKQYLTGVFAGTSESRRILVYGLVITTSQTAEAYKYIFRQFLTVMGSCPETVVTDEEFALTSALRDLKNEGVFTGQHLLDTFHILKKFRKVSDRKTYKLFRNLMQAKDRLAYRQLFQETLLSMTNDDQVELLRYFDYNSDRYCFSQIETTFVGIGISDSMNEKFHDLIKAKLPFESPYVKAVMVILEIITERNSFAEISSIECIPYEKLLNLPFMEPYRKILSNKIFSLLIKQVTKTFTYNVETEMNEFPEIIDSSKVFVKTRLGKFIVQQNGRGLWLCCCDFQIKSGFCCSHLVKVLMMRGQSLLPYLHKRWLVDSQKIPTNQLDFQFKKQKFHSSEAVRLRTTPMIISKIKNGKRRRRRTKMTPSQAELNLQYQLQTQLVTNEMIQIVNQE